MKNKICIYHHLGLGDTIECNGMIRHYSELYSQVDVFAKSNYYELVKYMYRDEPRIVINEVSQNAEHSEVSSFISTYEGEVLIPGHKDYFSNLSFFQQEKMGPGEAFYFLAKLPWDYRNEKFFIQRDLHKEKEVFSKLNSKNEKFIFVHDDIDRGFLIDVKTEYEIIKNDKSINMWHLIHLLEKAEEIHCMSSSILCLIDCLSSSIKFNKLFLHYNIRKVELGPNSLVGNWKII